MVRPLTPALLLAVGLGLAGCGSAPAPSPGYGNQRVAPLPSEVGKVRSEVLPDAEEALVELDLDGGGVAALWIDPQDIAKVFVQYSDPTDPESWSEPELVYEAGDGCLTMDAATAGTTVAVGLGCYETDAWIQQAPDEGVALVSSGFADFEVEQVGESIPVPEVSDDGGEVEFRNEVNGDEVDATWTRGDGF